MFYVGLWLICIVSILVPLEYVTPLADVDVKEGETAILTCKVNKPNVQAVWSKEGEKITPDNTKYTITVEEDTHTLSVADCTVDDDCEYTITIDNATSVGNVFVEGKAPNMAEIMFTHVCRNRCASLGFSCNIVNRTL